MKFSVVIPVYNVEEFLPDCVSSILSQSYADYEIVLVNDGSTDGSASLCDGYKDELGDRVVLVSQDNGGLLMARRAGFRAARGDVLVSVDGDDMLRSDALALIAAAFEEHDVDMVVYGASRKADYSDFFSDKPFESSRLVRCEDKHELFRRVCSSSALNSMCSKAVRREALDIENGYERYRGLSYGEDLLQSFEIIDRVGSAYYIDEPLYYYRVNYASLTKKFDRSQANDREAVSRMRMEYARKWEAEHGLTGLVDGSMYMWLNSYTALAQGSAEGLPSADAVCFMKELSESEGFREAYAYGDSRKLLRADFKVIAFLLAHGRFREIVALSRLKGRLRQSIAKR